MKIFFTKFLTVCLCFTLFSLSGNAQCPGSITGFTAIGEFGDSKYFISNDLLFSTNQTLTKRFIDLAPFSKFYMDSDKQSPGSIGKYIGLQIIRSYMINNPVTINTMLSTSTNEIFKRSADISLL